METHSTIERSLIIEDIRKPKSENSEMSEVNLDEYYINPICYIPIHQSTVKQVHHYKNQAVYFCYDGCKVKFEASPELYISGTP